MLPVVTVAVAVILLVVTYGFPTINCARDPWNVFVRQFQHANTMHILSNLFVFVSLIYMEYVVGSGAYLVAILLLITLQCFFELLLSRFLDLKCAVGFSGVVIGLFVWSIGQVHSFGRRTWFTIAIILVMSLSPGISFSGHAIGILSGLLLLVFYNPEIKDPSKLPSN